MDQLQNPLVLVCPIDVSGAVLSLSCPTYLVLCSCVPVRQLGWIRDSLLQTVCTERPDSDSAGSEERAQCPEDHRVQSGSVAY